MWTPYVMLICLAGLDTDLRQKRAHPGKESSVWLLLVAPRMFELKRQINPLIGIASHGRFSIEEVREIDAQVKARALADEEALLAVEDQEVHPERIEGRDEHAGRDREVGEARARQVALVHRLDDRVLRVEAGEERRADVAGNRRASGCRCRCRAGQGQLQQV